MVRVVGVQGDQGGQALELPGQLKILPKHSGNVTFGSIESDILYNFFIDHSQ